MEPHAPDLQITEFALCAQEPIRTPGSIQPHGVFLRLQGPELQLSHASANAAAVLRDALPAALGRPLAEVLAAGGEALPGDLLTRVPEQGIAHLRTLTLAGQAYNAIAHRHEGAILLELEEARPGEQGSLDALYPQLRAFIDELQALPDVATLIAAATGMIRRVTGFDRTLLYRFDAAWNGMVVAEDRNEALPSYLNLRFPASDIPAQARELYRLNRLRIIPDSAYRPVPILAAEDGHPPLDLTHCVLRSVSPVHVEYMRNMGTPASLSISIVEDGQLWGLISCHNATPRRVPVHVRTACDLLGQVLAMQIFALARASEARQREARQAIQTRLLALMAGEDNFVQAMVHHPEELLALAQADGAAVIVGEEVRLVAATPGEAAARAIAAWLPSTAIVQEGVFHTECLAAAMPGAEGLAERASGLLAISISQVHASYVLWFRAELVRTVRWGGDPRKSLQDERLHPRKSFAAWQQTVRQTATPWSAAEIDAVVGLRRAIVTIVMRQAEEMALLTSELKRSNKELEAFSYSISHDLRAPFRHIVGYAELLKDRNEGILDARSRRYIETIIESATSAGKLVDELLGFSQMGRSALTLRKVDMNRVVEEVRRSLTLDLAGREVEWQVERLPPVWGDQRMLRQVVENLLSNAIKYSRDRSPARIHVGSEQTSQETIYFVRDNGVGFDMKYVGKLFGVFQRLHRVEDYEGSGIGLANVRRIAERHGGRAWAEGAVGQGATFSVAIPRRMED
ncbi:ATP-binding protein [Roseomonas sp. USHLN139]|uniref:ATP-binding protein n=1 Tax=Roseomonas sp. USHLN139 TaxID=3081298 RepID=UPI003B01E8C7